MGAEWKHEVVGDAEYWINEQHGNIVKINDKYIAVLPKVMRFGPFDDLGAAKNAVESAQLKEDMNQLIDELNDKIVKSRG